MKKSSGRILAIGGAEDPDEKNMTILPYFVKMCGGKAARIVVCGAPSEKPKEKERKYDALFRRIGVANVVHADIAERADAEREELLEAARRATGVFFTGGDQLRLTSLIAGTRFGDLVSERLQKEGLMVGGTSAGAAAISSTMFTGGNDEGTVRRSDVRLAPGLGYLRDTVVDTHFAQRGRINRLFTVFAENPQILGIGLDENTAIDVRPEVSFHVIGEGAVFVFDGRVTHSNAADAEEEEVLAVTDVVVHVLPHDYSFDMKTQRPLKPDGTALPKRQ
ncbi:MAG TPA: cyanophycinase [Thermoanaerobaculia bacterium]|nr:cyanophycinase [Thermoanaerobaculia bacterium]